MEEEVSCKSVGASALTCSRSDQTTDSPNVHPEGTASVANIRRGDPGGGGWKLKMRANLSAKREAPPTCR